MTSKHTSNDLVKATSELALLILEESHIRKVSNFVV